MEKNTSGISRIVLNLEERERELLTAGLYEEAELVRNRISVYKKMQGNVHTIQGKVDDR